jgi:hypothetical protein
MEQPLPEVQLISHPRARFREQLADFEQDHPDLSAPQLARAFVQELTDQDRALVEDLLALDAQTLLADQFRVRFSRTRTAIFAALDIPSSSQDGQSVRIREPRKSLFEQISEWREYVPRVGHRPVLDMTRDELDQALEHRMGVLMTTWWRTELLRRLRAEFRNDTERVSDLFSSENLAELIITIRKEMWRGNLRLRVQPVQALPGAPRLPRQADGRRAKRAKADRGLAAQ